MKPINWADVKEATGGTMLEPGAYVCRITDVHDVPEKEYIWVEYDVAEGPQAGIYADMGPEDAWKHRYPQSYKEKALGMFKAFVNRVQESNRGFEWNGTDERQFVGKEVGLLFGKEYYDANDGTEKERTVVVRAIAAQDVRNGDYKIPAPRDRRADQSRPFGEAHNAPSPKADAGSSVYEEDIPF